MTLESEAQTAHAIMRRDYMFCALVITSAHPMEVSHTTNTTDDVMGLEQGRLATLSGPADKESMQDTQSQDLHRT